MADTVAPEVRRRIPRGLFGALVAFLLLPFPGICLAGPLVGCLLLARPRGLREWSWIGAAVLLGSVGFAASQSLAQEIFLAYGLAFTGAFLALRVWRPGPVLPRAAVAAIDTATLVVIGAWALGLEWGTIRGALETQFLEALTLVTSGSPVPAAQLEQLQATMRGMASVYPGVAILGAIAGGSLSSALAWYVTGGRSGPEPGPFRQFRFNDHLIWGAILTLGLALLRLRAPWSGFVANLLVVWCGLYTARGAAVTAFVSGAWPFLLRLSLALAAVFLLPYALGGLLLLGLADTWLEFRRVQPPTSQGAVDD